MGGKLRWKDIWLIIMDQSKHKMVLDLKDKIKAADLTEGQFCESTSMLYRDFSNSAAHGVDIPNRKYRYLWTIKVTQSP